MNPALTTVATFALGVFCGYLLRKNWFLVRGVLGKKSRNNKETKNEKPKTESSQSISKLSTEETEPNSDVSLILRILN